MITITTTHFLIWYVVGFLSYLIGSYSVHKEILVEDIIFSFVWGFGGFITTAHTLHDIANKHKGLKNFLNKRIL